MYSKLESYNTALISLSLPLWFLQNYGAFFDLVGAGITGPVKLSGPGGALDLSSADWTYQVVYIIF